MVFSHFCLDGQIEHPAQIIVVRWLAFFLVTFCGTIMLSNKHQTFHSFI